MPVARNPLQAMVLLWELLTPGWGFLFRWWMQLGRNLCNIPYGDVSGDLLSFNYKTSCACLCRRHGGLMFRLISVSPIHMFQSGEDRSSASQSFSLPYMMFRLVTIPAYYIIFE